MPAKPAERIRAITGRMRYAAWLTLVLALLQRYFFRVGGTQGTVDTLTVALLLLALALRIIAWRLSKKDRRTDPHAYGGAHGRMDDTRP